MLDPALRSEAEQALAYLGEMYPPLWRKLYLGCIEEEFSEEESFTLLKVYIRANRNGDSDD